MKGLFITFEGTDGSGKSTQIRLLNEYLTAKGLKIYLTREPGGCPIAEQLREIILNADNQTLSPACELLLYEAARAQHMSEIILPALERGEIVICDRFMDSTVAYQGYARGFSVPWIEELNRFAIAGRAPDLTIFLNLPPDAAFVRKGGKDANDRIEQADAAFFDKVYEGFLQLAAKNPERICTLNVMGTKYETQELVRQRIDQLIEKARQETE